MKDGNENKECLIQTFLLQSVNEQTQADWYVQMLYTDVVDILGSDEKHEKFCSRCHHFF